MLRMLTVFTAQAVLLLFTARALSEEAEQTTQDATANVSEQERACSALASADFSAIPDAATQITEVKMMKAEKSIPAFCMVKGYVAPSVGIKLGLPPNWNRKFMEVGCGGTCGIVDNAFSEGDACEAALRKGYACIATDAGHTGAWIDGLWGYGNLQAKLSWGYQAPHLTALAGKAITERYYGVSPRKSYFIGGSNGGRQALQEAQRFPGDFDGIVSLAPATDISTIFLTFAWGSRFTHDADGKALLGSAELRLLTDAAVAKCDLDDGVKDNVIGDPLHCSFDPSQLKCRVGQTSGCLTSIQVSAVKKVYAGPVSSTGGSLSLGGPLVGSESGGWLGSYVGQDGQPAGYTRFAIDVFRYLLFSPDPGPTWTLRDLDFDRDPKRLSTMQALYDATNPDLRKFKAAGGKLLIFVGLNDEAVLPRNTIDYYETLERTMGGRAATQSFTRLFLLPGISHGGDGDPGAGTFDYLTALEAWVEDGKAPDRLVAAHLKKPQSWTLEFPFPLEADKVRFTRPVYPYPLRAIYKGSGDPNDAASFAATNR